MGFDIKYKKVFDLLVWHNHFLADTFTPPPVAANYPNILPYISARFLEFEPSRETESYRNNGGLLFKNTLFGCFLTKKSSFAETDPMAKITLLGRLRDPLFLEYTNLKFKDGMIIYPRQGHVLYLHNKGLVPGGDGRINLSRSGGPFLTVNNHLFPWQTRIVRLPQLVAGTDTTVSIFDATSVAVTPLLQIALHSEPNQTDYELDCRALPSGLYRFDAPNLAANTVLYIGQEGSSSDVLTIVDIYTAGVQETIFDIRFNHIKITL